MKTVHHCRPRHFINKEGRHLTDLHIMQFDRSADVSLVAFCRRKGYPLFEVSRDCVTVDIFTTEAAARLCLKSQGPNARLHSVSNAGIKTLLAVN